MADTKQPKAPAGLKARGRKLWNDITSGYEIADKPAELVMLEEACRIADRLEALDEILRGDSEVWARLVHDLQTESYVLRIDSALSEARQQANQMKQLLAALRLPDEQSGKRPQQRGGARGAYGTNGAGAAGSVSSLDRARARATR
jgi:hypothetical protein